MDFTRREFLITGTAVGAIPAQGAPFPKVIYAGADDGKSVPLEHSTPTLCQQCPGGCGLSVRVVNECVVGIAGNPAHPIEVLILVGANPVFDSPHPERMKQALAKVPFVVSSSPWLDDSTLWADLIIPEKHFLSRWDIGITHALTGQPTVSVGQPVVPGPPGTGSTVDLILVVPTHVGVNYLGGREGRRPFF